MGPFRVLHISDTHLSPGKPWFVPNFDAMARIIAARQPDLVVNTGDIAKDGAELEEDLAFARERHRAIAAPLRTIPGNHDVGDNPWKPDLAHPITEDRLSRYRRHFGDDYWLAEAGVWVLVGADTQLFGSGLAAEHEQWGFLSRVPAAAGGRPVALFVHKPLFKDHPDEDDDHNRYVTRASRLTLLDALHGANLKLIASGHVHQHRHRRIDAVDHAWAPSTAYVLPDRRQPHIGVKRLGYIEYTFHADRVDIRIVEPPELINHDLDAFRDAS